MTAQPIWRSHRPGSSFGSEVGVRFGDELEIENRGPDGHTIVIVVGRRDVADLADALYRWLRENPPGRGGVVVDPREYAALKQALHDAGELACDRAGCGHPMDHHGIGTKPDRPTPCLSCLCPAFR